MNRKFGFFNKYCYNDRSELTESKRYPGTDIATPVTPIDPETRLYAYDPIGNRRTATENTDLTSYTSNNLNQYTALSGAKTAAPLHDDDGNLTDYKNTKYSWNAENQMISAEPKNPAEGDKKTEYLYDYMGRRAGKQIYVYASGTWTLNTEKLFVYDGWNLIKEVTKAGASSSDKFYVWGLDLSQNLQGAGGIGGLVCAVRAGEVRHYFYDANGNVGQVVSETGNIVARYEYDPFGNIVNGVSPTDDNPFRFSTKYFDEETGLYYYGFRYYSAELGRWWSRDTIGENDGSNMYAFIKNDSINSVDKLGMWKWKGGGHRQSNRRATIIAEECQDSYEKLAKIVRLDVNEIKNWLTPWKDNSKVMKDDIFTVPNTVVLAMGGNLNSVVSFLHKAAQADILHELERRGFFVTLYSQAEGHNKNQAVEAITNNDTWGYGLFGHGVKEIDGWKFYTPAPGSIDSGALTWDDSNIINAIDIKKPFKYGLGINYHCFANYSSWNEISLSYFGTHGMSFAIGPVGPLMLGYLGGWDSLVGIATVELFLD